MPLISKHQILEAGKVKTVVHEVPAWGGDVTLRMLSMAERIEIEERFMDGLPGEDGAKRVSAKEFQRMKAMIVTEALLDKDGERLFDTVDELYKLSGPVEKVIENLFLVITGNEGPKKSDTVSSSSESPEN